MVKWTHFEFDKLLIINDLINKSAFLFVALHKNLFFAQKTLNLLSN